MGKPLIKKRFLFLASMLLAFWVLPSQALTTEAPYYSYRYDHWGNAVETAQSYLPSQIISGESLGCGAFNLPTDLAATSKGVYILDSGNGRVVFLDNQLRFSGELKPADQDGKPLSMREPSSIFVREDADIILITDKKAGVYVFNQELKLIRTLVSPDSDVLPEDFLFAPVNALMDSAGIIYVISANCYQGALQYDEQGRFLGFFGSEKVTLTLETLINRFWKSVLTEQQARNMRRTVPVEFVSFCIDQKDFIYTVRKGNDVSQGQVKKLNAEGSNIIPEEVFGDRDTTTMLSDVTVDSDGFISILDSNSGRIFQYSDESRLLYAFGGKGNQKGLAQVPVAIEAWGENLLLLDNQMGLITVMRPTIFAQNVRKAVNLCIQGKYKDAIGPWSEVLKQDSNYEMANQGLGKAYEGMQQYDLAAGYFRKAYEKELYSDAFSEIRRTFLRQHFSVLMAVLSAAVLLPVVIIIRRRKYQANIYNKTIHRYSYPVYCMFHPFTGFEDLKEKKKDSFALANLLLLAYLFVSILIHQLTGFAFNSNRTDKFNFPFMFLSTIGVFAAFVLCNWSITTIMEGKGRLKEIWNYCAYALLPYITGMAVYVIASNVLTLEEAAFLNMIKLIVYGWTAISLLTALKEVHMYTLGKTIWTVVLTLAGMLVVLLICAISYNVLTEMFEFISNVYTEIRLR